MDWLQVILTPRETQKKKDCNSFINYLFPILGPEAELLYITFTNLDDLTIRDFKKKN